uniref:Uncharacterized protein n=1 Tax=Caudovirales sp. ct2A51 TaxID=2827630 RepID=A0A8S5T0R0_9CAUD|nr:MAG TPA: hypothetical protein [Caudovirales sp. ct2A51]
MDNLTERLDALRQKLQEPDFLQRKGLSNEVGIWIFQYNAADEMAVRHFTRQIAADQELHCRIIERNLYEIFLAMGKKNKGKHRFVQAFFNPAYRR